jgi:hypothetical protein
MLVGWWFYEPEGTGWESWLHVLVMMVGVGMIVDNLRDLLW